LTVGGVEVLRVEAPPAPEEVEEGFAHGRRVRRFLVSGFQGSAERCPLPKKKRTEPHLPRVVILNEVKNLTKRMFRSCFWADSSLRSE
jgi:hypothetical protein